MQKILVTGSSGLIGSEVVAHFARQGYTVHGVDNNMRATFFGPQGDTRWNQQRLVREFRDFRHHELDIRERAQILDLLRDLRPDAIIHSHDVVAFMAEFLRAPRAGEVYNLGGGKQNSISILEAFAKIEAISGLPMRYVYSDQNRTGDHICYYSDLGKMRAHYPAWDITKSLDTIFAEIAESWYARQALGEKV